MTNKDATTVKMLFEPIFVPVNSDQAHGVELMKFNLDTVTLALGFSSALKLAKFCGDQVHFVETNASELFGQLIAMQFAFGFDFTAGCDSEDADSEDAEGEIFDLKTLSGFLKHMENDLVLTNVGAINYTVPDMIDAFQESLENLVLEFESRPKLAVVGQENGPIILVVQEAELQTEFGLLAKLHKFARGNIDLNQISILTCRSFFELGAEFEKCVQYISPKASPAQLSKPPILRY